MNTKKIVYMVTYKDDRHRTHMTFVENFSSVRFLEDRFDNVYFEATDNSPELSSCEEDYEELFDVMLRWNVI